MVGASAVLDRYGAVVNIIENDGFKPDAKIFMLVEGETPATMAKSTALGLMELPAVFEQLKPDIVLTVGDRFETMATALAAVYMNIPLAHTMGGEVSGTIDESVRHAVTKLAHIHFPATEDAKERILRMGEREENVYMVGCPRMDLVVEVIRRSNRESLKSIFEEGVGPHLDISKPFLLLSQHPITTEYGSGEEQIRGALEAVVKSGVQTIALWPNADAGADDIARGMRTFREKSPTSQIHFFKNLPPETYLALMKYTACLVGNSSSAIREGAFIGTPAVNIGSRQNQRQRGNNVIDAGSDKENILGAIRQQIAHGPYESNPIYGDGQAGSRIAEILASCNYKIQKTIVY